jgi:hypothetical protein
MHMQTLSRGKATHSDKLERWLGKDQVEAISKQAGSFYYPIPLHGVPGNVFAMPGGDFAGQIQAGSFGNKHDKYADVMRKIRLRAEQKIKQSKAFGAMIDLIRVDDRRMLSVGAFASIDAVVAAVTGGKGQALNFAKNGVASNAIGNSNDLWTRAGQPVAGAAGAAAPGGTVLTSATPGALGFKNLGAANTGHYLNWALAASVVNNSLLLYDRLFSVAAGAALTTPANTAVTGVPTRYQNTIASAQDYIGGNFAFPSNPTTVLAAIAHNWAVGGGAGVGMTYLNQANAAANMPVAAGVSACVVGGIDLAAGQSSWFAPLASGDVGIKALTNMLSSAAVATGTIDWVIGHPIAINACPIANIACLDDGLYTSLNLTAIFDNACLSFLELPKAATTATTYSGLLRAVSE